MPDKRPAEPRLPETQWLFRRLYVYVLTTLLVALLVLALCLMPRGDLQLVTLHILGVIVVVAVIYLIAPSAPELGVLIGNVLARFRLGRRAPPAAPPEDVQ